MTNRLEFYRCEVCGNIVQVMHAGAGELVCCGNPMTLLQPHSVEEEKKEKHVPVFIEDKIQVGSIPHPMIEEHHIEFIQSITNDKKTVMTKFLDLNNPPEVILNKENNYNIAQEYCNIHGLWLGVK